MSTETIEVSEIVLEVTEPAVEPAVPETAVPETAPAPVVPEPAPAPTSQGLFDSIDWKNPVPSVIKLATTFIHLIHSHLKSV